MAAVEGSPGAVADVYEAVLADERVASAVELLGPVEMEPVPGENGKDVKERALLRVPRTGGRALAAALAAAQATRASRKAPDPVRVRLDPSEIG
jgi:primosomal protein N' (replication factor Y)